MSFFADISWQGFFHKRQIKCTLTANHWSREKVGNWVGSKCTHLFGHLCNERFIRNDSTCECQEGAIIQWSRPANANLSEMKCSKNALIVWFPMGSRTSLSDPLVSRRVWIQSAFKQPIWFHNKDEIILDETLYGWYIKFWLAPQYGARIKAATAELSSAYDSYGKVLA